MDKLTHINDPSDLRKLPESELPDLCRELREFLIREILGSGGHFSANLGTVELTVALHYIFQTPEVPLIWDVGHQAYGHKVLTGRRDALHGIRKSGGLSGFPKREESIYDSFGTGHSSTSISAALGMASAFQLSGSDLPAIAVIGDGSLTAGMAWEALNNAGTSKANLIVVINDNQIGIDMNNGALHHYLGALGTEPERIFGAMGFQYSGPVDGHSLPDLLNALRAIKLGKGPRILHVRTVKGKGYKPAEEEQTKWHAVKYVKVGEEGERSSLPKFQQVFGDTLLELARRNERIIGVTPAMPSGCSMDRMMQEFPERVFDVGIAEQHAVTFSAGMALGGYRVFCNVYSSFFQRAYDQYIHDVCLQSVPVVFCLDRAGVVGEDGPTHHGMYDLAFLRPIPNTLLAAPSGAGQLSSLMEWAAEYEEGPVVIRYPRGRVAALPDIVEQTPIEPGGAIQVLQGDAAVILNLGALLHECMEAIRVSERSVALWDMIWLKPLNFTLLDSIFDRYNSIVCVEDGVVEGGFFSAICEYAAVVGYEGRIQPIAFPDEIIPHATREELLEMYGLNAGGIASVLNAL